MNSYVLKPGLISTIPKNVDGIENAIFDHHFGLW